MIFSEARIKNLVNEHGTPLYAYSKQTLINQAQQMLSVPAPYGLTIRYAMKANPHKQILKTFKEEGIQIDASSGYEAESALQAGFKPQQILVTAQQLPHNLAELIQKGVKFNATSLHQLKKYGELFPGQGIGVRINPGVGSGHSVKVNVGGKTSSFGIWHEYISKVQEICAEYDLTIERLHTHIGSGTDPAVWQEVIKISLELIKNFPEATIINLGGGFKVARMPEETGADMSIIGEALVRELKLFEKETKRKLHLELEPGTFLTANAGMLIALIDDIVNTGKDGYNFIKLNTGMNDFLRTSMYGAQHPIHVLNKANKTAEYVVVGHNCESADLLTPAPGDAEVLRPRVLNEAKIGDIVVVEGAGAYCASMAAHGYNSFPSATEIVI